MNIEVKIAITAPDGAVHEHVIARLDKGCETSAEIGLSIAESKALLLRLQQDIVTAQTRAFCAGRSVCPACGRKLRGKGARQLRFRTVFGDIPVHSPPVPSLRVPGAGSADLQPADRADARSCRAGDALAGDEMGVAGLLRRHG